MSHAERSFWWMPVQIHSCHALQDNGRHHHSINSPGDHILAWASICETSLLLSHWQEDKNML